MRTRAWETASQIAPRNCSQEMRGEVGVCVILVKGVNCHQAHKSAEGCWSPEEWSWSWTAGVSVKDVSAFLHRRQCTKLGL